MIQSIPPGQPVSSQLLHAIDYKLKLMQDYVKELFAEKKFLDFRREKEKELDKETYLNYISDESVRAQLIGTWYKEFVEK